MKLEDKVKWYMEFKKAKKDQLQAQVSISNEFSDIITNPRKNAVGKSIISTTF